ncbi:MAG: hypothetical protein V3T03_02305 [Candidatus Bipolaricaulota bacterium]
MRNALILTGIWLGILVTAYAIVFWDQGIDRPLPISVLEEQVVPAELEYIHPDRLFSLPIPMGWQVIEEAEYVQLTDPNESILVWVVTVDTLELDTSLDAALTLLDLGPEFVMTSAAVPADAWTGEDVSVIYQRESEDDVVSVRARRPQDWTVVMLTRGPERALDALSENIEWIWSELGIPADEFLLL